MLKVVIINVLLLLGCSSRNQLDKEQPIIFSKFAKETKIDLIPFFKFDKGVANKLYINDSSLIILNSNGNTDFFFYQYSLSKKSIENKFLIGGRKYGQALSVLSSGIFNNILWFHDITLSKIVTVDLKKLTKNIDSSYIKEYSFDKIYTSVQIIDSLSVLASGAYHSKNKIQEIDLIKNKEIREFGYFDNVPNAIPYYSWKKGYDGFLFANLYNKKAVLASRLTDQIEIFDLTTESSKVIKGPENYKAEFTSFRANNEDFIQRNEKSRFSFVNGMVTNKYIYLLYSGNKHDSKYLDHGKYIYVYDWNGKPIRKINLGSYISSFVISEDDTIIYAFDINSGFIVSAKII